jgi:LysR family glycine cleavage system transcriptional activator
MPVTHRTPPIQYLTAFVAAARYNSFKVAANSLNVSPSAISQQIKSLERHLGLSLFNRQKRDLRLTRAGKSFYQVAEKTINQYEAGYAHFAEQHFSPSLKVSMIPYIANELIIPKLHHFQEKYPDLNLAIETTMQIEDLASTELDAAIRFGTPPWKGYDSELISKAQSTLVATDDYFKKHPIKSAADWQQQTLIHIRSNTDDWQRFMNQIGFQFKPKKELYFDSYAAAIRAAEEGLGIALGVLPISQHKILNGQLSAFSNKHVPLEESFYLVTQTNENKQEHYQQLLQWLKEIFAENVL